MGGSPRSSLMSPGVIHASDGKRLLLASLKKKEGDVANRALVMLDLASSHERIAHAWVSCRGLPPRETMEPGIYRGTTGRCLASPDAADRLLIGGQSYATSYWKHATKINTLPYRRTEGVSLTHNQIPHSGLAWTTRQCLIPVSIKVATSCRQS